MTATCPPDHKHGATSTCYSMHGCRCDACRAGRNAYTKHRTRQKAYGRWNPGEDLVDAEPVRAHVRSLMDRGLGAKRVAHLAGVSEPTIKVLIYGRTGGADGYRHGEMQNRIRRDKADRILAVRADESTLALVPTLGARRRAQALACLGWSIQRQAGMLGFRQENYRATLGRERMERASWEKVRDLYDRLSMTPPVPADRHEKIGVTRAKNEAARRGWVPPLAWDNIDHDPEPAAAEQDDAAVSMASIYLAIEGKATWGELTPAERHETIGRLRATGMTDSAIADHLHTHYNQVARMERTAA